MRKPAQHRWRTGLFASVLAVATVSAALGAPSAQAAGTLSGKVFIQLGDSFASGEGGGWEGNSESKAGNRQGTDRAARQDSSGDWIYRPETYVYHPNTYRELYRWWPSGSNPCHRSYDAPILHAKGYYSDRAVNLACSGAQSKNIWLPSAGGVEQHAGLKTQLEQLQDAISSSDDVAMVVITVGGNDISIPAYDKPGFGALVKGCIKAYVYTYDLGLTRQCRDEIEAGAGGAISTVFYNTLKTVDQVRTTLAAEGHPVGSYKLVVTGYPSITPSEFSGWSSISEVSHWSERCPIRRYDSSYVNLHVVSRLNDVIQAAAEERGAGFINMEQAFGGHRLCEEGTFRGGTAADEPRYAEWVRYMDIDVNAYNPIWEGIKDFITGEESDERASFDLGSQRSIAESFHPNTYGQAALGNCLQEYYNADADGSHQRCFVGGVGPYDTPDYMVTGSLAALTKVTDDPAGGINITYPLTRSVTVPDSVGAGHYFQWLPTISHPRKGQLRVEITAPNGTVFRLRDYNPDDTGGWANGTFTRDYTADPSGTWTLRIWDQDLSSYNGTLDRWSLKLF